MAKKIHLSPKVIVQLEQLLQSALGFHQSGNFSQAKQLYQQIVKVNPSHALATHYLGAIEHQEGNSSKAEQLIRKSIKLDPTMFQAYNNLGVILLELDKPDQAISNYLKLIKLKPNYADAHCNLGAVYDAQKEYGKAIDSLKNAIKLNPNYVNAYNTLGVIYRKLDKLDDSISCLSKVIKLEPNFAEAHNNLANALFDKRNYKAAISSYQSAIEYKPNYAEAYSNLGRSYKKAEQFEKAVKPFEQALALQPQNTTFLTNFAFLYHDICMSERAVEFYKKIIQIDPNEVGNLIQMNCFSEFDQAELYQSHLDWGNDLISKLPSPQIKHKKLSTSQTGPIRIGYVSPDFREHSVSYFFEPLIANHDKEKFEIYCYYNNTESDHVTQKIQSHCDHWRPIYTLEDAEVVKKIKKDKIDILVDLSGHTDKNRLPVFAYKPAPIQVSWLGYPNTTGLRTIDYRITDEQCDPESENGSFHCEKLIRLPHGFLCFKGDESIKYEENPPVLTNNYITFGSFNNFTKVTVEVLELWSKILLAIPTSRLLMKASQLANDMTKQNVISILNSKGVQTERVTLLGRVNSYDEHLKLYSKVDIALDPFPYNGTTTTIEALWMGVPTLTYKGVHHISRVGTSIMCRAGLDNFVASDKTDFLNKAIILSSDTQYLNNLRSSIRERMVQSDLCNAKQFTQDMEHCFANMIDNHSK